MWEEHPEYQKQQAKMIGVLILLVFALYVGYCIEEQDWALLKSVLEFAGAFIAVLAVFPICAWLLVKLLKRNRTNDSTPKQKDDI